MEPIERPGLSSENILKVLRILKRVMGTLEVKSLCRALAEAVVSEVGHLHHVSVYLLYRHSGYLSEVAIAGPDTEAILARKTDGRVQPVGEGILGRVARSGEPYVTGDVSQDPYYLCVLSPAIRSELCVPIRVEEEVIGVLNMESSEANAFGETEVCLCEALADLVGNCISNSVLHEQVGGEEEEVRAARREVERAERVFGALARLTADVALTLSPKGEVQAIEGAALSADHPAATLRGRAVAELFDTLPAGALASSGGPAPAGQVPLGVRPPLSAVVGEEGEARFLPLLDEHRRSTGTLLLLRRRS
ncbi:MAG: GAF domain-containing protein [Planctomycetes bacterium]|nr:GAF domain-containing protein [Planctomycetota bacterium]